MELGPEDVSLLRCRGCYVQASMVESEVSSMVTVVCPPL